MRKKQKMQELDYFWTFGTFLTILSEGHHERIYIPVGNCFKINGKLPTLWECCLMNGTVKNNTFQINQKFVSLFP